MKPASWAALLLLSAALRAGAAEFRVGDVYATIQAAVDAALAAGGTNEVQVKEGLWRERVVIRPRAGDRLTVSGGWRPGFRRFERAPRSSVIDGGGVARVVQIDARAGSVTFDGFTVTGGDSGASNGGGVWLWLRGDAVAYVVDNAISENHLSGDGALGGGMSGLAEEDALLSVLDNAFKLNSVSTSSETLGATCGGAELSGRGRARLVVSDNGFFDNSAAGAFSGTSALCVGVGGSATATVEDNVVHGNRSLAQDNDQFALWLSAFDRDGGTPSLVARRNTVVENSAAGKTRGSSQVGLSATGAGARVQLTDGVVARGDRRGITTFSEDGGRLVLTNLTVTSHPRAGIAAVAFAAAVAPALSNSIAFANAPDLEGSFAQLTNLAGTDPRFVDAPNGDYRLAPGSPGIDAGTNDPPGGLGPLDVEGRRRVMGPAVDVGAHETIGDVPPGPGGGMPGPDEPSCRILWSGVDRTTHACRCALDRSLPNFNCGFLGPEIFLDLRVPWPPVPPTPTKLGWTLHPWASVAGPYDIEMAARLDGKWAPLQRLGPGAPSLEDGKLVVEPFALELSAKRRILLRTRFSYLPSGAEDPAVAELDVLLPKPPDRKE